MLALFLTESAVGSLLVLLLVPPRAAGRRFFQLTTAQSCVLILLALLMLPAGPDAGARRLLFGLAAALLMLSASLFHLGRLSQGFGLMVAALAPGLTGVVRDALALIPARDVTALSRLLYPLDAITAGLAVGSVLIAMILGHYYLNIPGLSIGHLQRLAVVFMAAIGLRVLVVGVTIARTRHQIGPLFSLLLDTQARELPDTGLDPFVLVFLLVHLLFGAVAPSIMAVMAWRTSLISSTQSATGILYVALVMVIMGELVSRYILTLTSIPL